VGEADNLFTLTCRMSWNLRV